MQLTKLLWQSVRAGTIASVAIVPLAPLFKAAGLRIGHYGPKFAGLYLDNPQPWHLFAQHLVIGWLSALPLLVLLGSTALGRWPLGVGAVYGALYYVAINSLALPGWFGDALPWKMGAATVLPSLVGHVVFGAIVGWVAPSFPNETRNGPRSA